MKPDVDQRKEAEGLKILHASYGTPEAERLRPWELRIVTDKLRELASRCQKNEFVLDKRWNGLFGDPCPREKKILTVHYSINGLKNIGVWEEDSVVFLQSASFRRESMDQTYRSSDFGEMNDDLFKAIMVYLPVFPDQLACSQVCKAWHDVYSSSYTLSTTFKVGAPGIPGPCYRNMPVSFVNMVLSKSFASLVHLDLDNYDRLDDSVLSDFLRNLKQLKVLCLNNCSQITDKSLSLIASHNTALTQLEIKGLTAVTDESCAAIATNCVMLERLNLSNCSEITDVTVKAVAQNLNKLVILHMKHCYKATDLSLKYLGLKQNDTLELLSLWSMHKLTDKGLEGFQNRSFSKLSSINFSGCYGFSNHALSIVSKNCKQLLNVNLSFCHRLTDNGVICLAENLLLLEHLDLNYVYQLTDKAIYAICARLSGLRSLNLTRCIEITPSAVVEAAEVLNSLTELCLKGCRNFSDSSVQDITTAVVSREGRLYLLDMRDCDAVSQNAGNILEEGFNKKFLSYEKLFLLQS
mmetsp:Transcript_11790/g.13586  ORF Transcript_11790/g.13586 Transcript_11790/m.13586 type:complete len:523 (+) Transcript_11790:84-1652(+)